MAFLTLPQMIASMPDAGAFTAAELRAVVNSIIKSKLWAPYSIDHAEDIFWDGDDLAGFTTVTVTGAQTVTEKDGYVAVEYSGQAANDYNGIFKARTFAIGDSFAVRVRALGPGSQFSVVGLAFTDGVVATSNLFQSIVDATNGNVALLAAQHGTLTSSSTSPWNSGTISHHPWIDGIVVRLTYVAANSFLSEFSLDGTHWTSFGNAATAKTMTPTHVGLTWSKEAGTIESQVLFGPLCRLS